MRAPPGKPPATVGTLIAQGERRFKRARLSYGHGLADAHDEAAFLTLNTLKLPLHNWPASRKVSVADAARVIALFERRVRDRVPAPYLVNAAWLGPHRFYVDERVLVPRSYIAELLLEDEGFTLPPAAHVSTALDLCTGSGCLAILLARRYKKAHVDASDISADALDVAQRNVREHRLTKRVKCLISNYFLAFNRRRYDLIISNPPYVTGRAMRRLPAEYRHEPALGLAAGADGLDALRVILRDAPKHLNRSGTLIVECGHARKAVERAWPRLPFLWVDTSGGDDCVFVLTREALMSAD